MSNALLTLRVLRSLAGPLQTVLLALFDSRVSREEPSLAQRRPERLVGLDERSGQRVRDRARLAGDSTADHPGANREPCAADRPERLRRDVLERRARQVDLQRAPVHGDLAVARCEQDTRDRGLAAPDGGDLVALSQCGLLRLYAVALSGKATRTFSPRASMFNGFGPLLACGWFGPAYTLSFRYIWRPSALCGSMPLTARSMSRSGNRARTCATLSARSPPG